MKSFFKYILFLILLNVGLVAKSETIYPIQLYATMLPPYTNCISDYITDGMHRMKLTAVVRDMNNHSFNQVRVLIQVKMGDKIKYEATTYPAVLGQAKMMHDISVTALNNIIVGDGKEGGCLEEGSYEFVFQVFDAHNSSLPLSEPVSIYCYLDKPEPPVCIYPKDGDCIKDGGVINFTWMDAVASNLSSKEYKFELLEDITPEPSNSDLLPMFGDKDIAGKKGILERTIYNSNVYTLNYAGVLQTGRKYYWRVTNVTDASKANYTNGANKYSELSSFTFGDCNPATPEEVKKEVEELSEKLEIKSVDTDSKSVSATITWGLEGSDDVEALKKFCKYKLYFTRKKNSNESVDATASESNEENQESETDDNKPDEDSNVKSVDDIEDEFVVEVGNVNTYTITSVERTQIYNVRVEGITCDENKEISGKTDKSEPKDFMIPQLESEECNSNIKEVECQSLATLEKGASFFANDDNVVVKVTELDQSKSNDETHVYSGKGIVTCTIFKEKLGLNVEFKNIKVNKDNHLCDGVVEVVSSEENNLMVNLNDVAGKGRTASKAPEQKEVKNVENKEEITDPKKNQEHRNNVVTNGSTLYAVNNTGGSESVGTLVNDVTPSTSSLDNEDGVVMFDVEKNLENNSWTPYIDMGAYPFLNTSIVRDYERMGGSYIVPWLAMESGDFKWIKAKPTLKDNKDIKRFDDLNFYAKIGGNYYQLDSKKIENGNSFDYNVKVFGADANKSYSIYAMSKDKSKTFGRLEVYSMKNKEIKVKLVPVINKVEFENSLTDFQDRLNKIFEPLAKKFIFKMDEKPFTNDDIKETIDEQQNLDFLNEGLNTSEGSDIFANETDEMKWLRKLYQKNTSDDNSYDAYLFLIPKNTKSEIKGFMPRTYSVGYLFVGEDGEKYDDINTAAHELCHGVFGLQHAFDYEGVVKGGVEENLMDYSTADIFRYPSKYFQWYNIENPSDYHFPFVDTPEDGEYTDEKRNLRRCIEMIRFAYAFDENLHQLFMDEKLPDHISSFDGISLPGYDENDHPMSYVFTKVIFDLIGLKNNKTDYKIRMKGDVILRKYMSINRHGIVKLSDKENENLLVEYRATYNGKTDFKLDKYVFWKDFNLSDQNLLKNKWYSYLDDLIKEIKNSKSSVNAYHPINVFDALPYKALEKLKIEQRIVLLDGIIKFRMTRIYPLITKLISSMPENQYDDFFDMIDQTTLLYDIYDKLSGNKLDNYMASVLNAYYKQKNIKKKIAEAVTATRSIIWQDRFLRPYYEYDLDGPIKDGNVYKVKVKGTFKSVKYNGMTGTNGMPIYANVDEPFCDFTARYSDILIVNVQYGDLYHLKPSFSSYPIPMFYFQYLQHRQKINNFKTYASVVATIASMAIGAGQLYVAVNAARLAGTSVISLSNAFTFGSLINSGASFYPVCLQKVNKSPNITKEKRKANEEMISSWQALSTVLDAGLTVGDIAYNKAVSNKFSLFLTAANVFMSLASDEETKELKSFIKEMEQIMKDLTGSSNNTWSDLVPVLDDSEKDKVKNKAKSIVNDFYYGKALTKEDYYVLKGAFDIEIDEFYTGLINVNSTQSKFLEAKSQFILSYSVFKEYFDKFDYEILATQIPSGSQPSIKEFIKSWSKLTVSYIDIIEDAYPGNLELSAIDFLFFRLRNNLNETTVIISVPNHSSGKLGIIEEINVVKNTDVDKILFVSDFDKFIKSWNGFYEEYVDKEEKESFKCVVYKDDIFCTASINNLINSWNNIKYLFKNEELDDFNSFLELLKEKIK